MLGQINSKLSDLCKIENLKKAYTLKAKGGMSVVFNVPQHDGYTAIGIVGFSTTELPVYVASMILYDNGTASLYLVNTSANEQSNTANIIVLYFKNF